MNKLKPPLTCPKCKEVTSVIEIADGIVAKHSYTWDSELKKYKLDYEDEDNYGDLYLECSVCMHRFTQDEYYTAFQPNTIDIEI